MTEAAYSDDARTLTLTRDYPHSIARVWAAVATPARIADWMGVEWIGDEDTTLEQGGHFDYRFADTDLESRAHVLRYEPPRLIEHSWFENMPPAARVRWALEEIAGGTRLTLTHFLPQPEDASRTGAGWTVLLERLAGSLGDTPEAVDWRRTRDDYAERFGVSAMRDGRLTKAGDRQILSFERILHHSPDQVWKALTTPDGIGRWWQADAEIEPRVEGIMALHFREFGHRMSAKITDFGPPNRFGFDWRGHGHVLFELSPDARGTYLRLTHDLPAEYEVLDVAAGWHWHLDGLDNAAEGIATPWDQQRFEVLKTIYRMTL